MSEWCCLLSGVLSWCCCVGAIVKKGIREEREKEIVQRSKDLAELEKYISDMQNNYNNSVAIHPIKTIY
tara:strand:- start:16 stop:222 length:207 start_codon:yes stop_codon:yes gene_type:complete